MFDGCVQWVMKNIIPVPYMYDLDETDENIRKNSSFTEHFDEFSSLLSKCDDEYQYYQCIDDEYKYEVQDGEYWGFWIQLS